MAVTQADIDALNAAIASGERQVAIGGQSITYQTVDSLIKARDDMRNQLAAAQGKTPPRRKLLYYAGRGY
jgi:hypothetical protein